MTMTNLPYLCQNGLLQIYIPGCTVTQPKMRFCTLLDINPYLGLFHTPSEVPFPKALRVDFAKTSFNSFSHTKFPVLYIPLLNPATL